MLKERIKLKVIFWEESIVEPLELSQFLFFVDRLYLYLLENENYKKKIIDLKKRIRRLYRMS